MKATGEGHHEVHKCSRVPAYRLVSRADSNPPVAEGGSSASNRRWWDKSSKRTSINRELHCITVPCGVCHWGRLKRLSLRQTGDKTWSCCLQSFAIYASRHWEGLLRPGCSQVF